MTAPPRCATVAGMGPRGRPGLHAARLPARGDRDASARELAQCRFVSTAAHELRTPLTSLHLMLGLVDEELRKDEPDLEDARELLARALGQSARVTALCRDL